MSVAHAFYILYSFRVSANGRFLFRRASPATCSPPLGGSDGGSAELVHARRKVWRARKLARLPCNWLYSQPSFAAPTINWSWRGSRSARLGVLYLRRSLLECRDTYGGLFLRAAGLFCISTRHAHTNVCKYLIFRQCCLPLPLQLIVFLQSAFISFPTN